MTLSPDGRWAVVSVSEPAYDERDQASDLWIVPSAGGAATGADVVIHGGPHSQWIDQWVIRWNYHLLGAPGYAVLLTNYTGSTGFGEAFAQGIQGDPLEGPGRELLEAADEAIKRYPFINASKQVAGGASYGGHLANWLVVTTTRFKAFVSHAGPFDQVQPVDDERRDVLARGEHGRARVGEVAALADAESDPARDGAEDADPRERRRA